MICTVAMIQLKILPERKKTVDRAVQFINECASKGADIVILPEMFCCEYNPERVRFCAEPEGAYIYKKLSAAASENNVYVVGGSIPELSESGAIYNTSYVFDRNGKNIAKHRKSHLFDVDIEGGIRNKESDTITIGNDVTVFDTEFGKIGLCICYDFRFPELARLMVNRGAFMTIVPAVFNTTTGPKHWELMFRSRAVDNQMYTVGVAPARNNASAYVSYAHSIMVSPWGDIIKELGEEEEICIQEINTELVSEVRNQLPLLKHRNTNLYRLHKL